MSIPTNSGVISAANTGTTVPSITSGSAVQAQGNSSAGAATLTIPAGQVWSGALHFYESNDGETFTQIADALILDRSTGVYGAISSGATNKTYQVPTSAGVVYVMAATLASGSVEVVLASGTGLMPSVPENPLQAIDSSGTITLGGTAQQLFGGVIPANGYEIINTDPTNVLWVCDNGGVASPNGAGCFELFNLGGSYCTPPNMRPSAPISIFGPVTGAKFVARRF